MNKKCQTNKINKLFNAIKLLLTILLILSLSFTWIANSKQKAFAYQLPKVTSWKTNINASIGTDGSISVTESKIIDINSFVEKAKKYKTSGNKNTETNKNIILSPMVWSFNSFADESYVNPGNTKISLINSEDQTIGAWSDIPLVKFQDKWHGNDGPSTNALAYEEKEKQLCLYTPFTNPEQYTDFQTAEIITSQLGTGDVNLWDTCKAIIKINYVINCTPHVYKDVADIQWRYITDSWVNDSHSTDLQIRVPVGQASIANPLGKITNLEQNPEATTERNIYAWGHGSSSGVVNFDPTGIVTIKNDIVPGGTDASLRIVFPSAWLTNLNKNIDTSQTNQTKLTSILKEESVWRDWRTDSVNKMLVPMFFIGLCALVLFVVLIIYIRYRQKFQNEGIVTARLKDMHPSVLFRLKNWNREHPGDIVNSLLNMYKHGVIDIKKMPSSDYEITLKDANLAKNPYASDNLDIIDIRTINLLFTECACFAAKTTLYDIYCYAKARPYKFITSYLTWQSLLSDQINQIINFKSSYDKLRHVIFAIAGAILLISVMLGVFFADWICPVSGILSSLVIAYVANNLRNKVYYLDDNGNRVDASKVKIDVVKLDETTDKFKNAANKSIEDSVLAAQDNVSKFGLTNS